MSTILVQCLPTNEHLTLFNGRGACWSFCVTLRFCVAFWNIIRHALGVIFARWPASWERIRGDVNYLCLYIICLTVDWWWPNSWSVFLALSRLVSLSNSLWGLQECPLIKAWCSFINLCDEGQTLMVKNQVCFWNMGGPAKLAHDCHPLDWNTWL